MAASEFELLGNVPIGQYLPTGSVLHRLDPRVKLGAVTVLLALSVGIPSLMGMCLLLIALTLGYRLGRLPLLWALRSLRAMLPFLLLLSALQMLIIPSREPLAVVLWQQGPLILTDRSLLAGILLILRFAVMVLGLGLFSLCTTTSHLTHGIEHLLLPAQRLGIPTHEFAMVVNIAIRYLPMVAADAERLLKAQASRGADLGTGRGSFMTRVRRLIPLLVPLFLSSLRSAEDLTEAMEARGYVGGRDRSHLIQLSLGPVDWLALGVISAVAAMVVAASISNVDARLSSSLLCRLMVAQR